MMNGANSTCAKSARPAESVAFFKWVLPDAVPVTPESVALFRFGERCNNHCPMCSNTGDSALASHSTEELLRRAEFLRTNGFRRVVVTGGEATIHPGFWTLVEHLAADGITWDINTHGRTFAAPGFAERAVGAGLRRAIVSLHSFDPATSAAIFGANEEAHHETVEGIGRLVSVDVEVMLNFVLNRLNLEQLEEYLLEGSRRFGSSVIFKVVFPSTIGKGGRWPGIASLRYSDVKDVVRRARQLAVGHALNLAFESFPNCILDDPHAVNVGRSGFGETHYLDDALGNRVYSMRHIEAELSAFGERCKQCASVKRCSGVGLAYARQNGVDELIPFLPDTSAVRTGDLS